MENLTCENSKLLKLIRENYQEEKVTCMKLLFSGKLYTYACLKAIILKYSSGKAYRLMISGRKANI